MTEKTAKTLLAGRKAAYRAVFDPAAAKTPVVLADLAKFCRANESTYHPDARTHALMEGRREVWLRIRDHIDLTVEQQLVIYGAQHD